MNHPMKWRLDTCPAREAGITLLELLTAMTIVGILSAIAIPSYVGYIARTNRSAAQACLSEHAQFMERYYTSHLTYVGAAPTPDCRTGNGLDQRYEFTTSIPPPTRRTYTVTATPIRAQATRDAKCGTLTINEGGQPTASGPGGVAACW
jgi:type IV pilus assembly protein PilE